MPVSAFAPLPTLPQADDDPLPQRRRAVLILVLTALLWSSSGLFIKLIAWGPLSILGGRSLVALVVFLVYLRRIDLRWTPLQIAGALGYVGAQMFFIIGTKLTTSANVVFLSYTAPVYVILFGYWFLGERPQRADWAAVPIIFTGMLLFFGDNLSLEGIWGNLFGVLSGLSFAVMMLCMRRQKSGTPAKTILIGNILGALIGLPFLVQESFAPASLGIILYLGIFQIGISMLLYSYAIKHLQVVESALILTLEPILNPVWVFLVIGEMPGPLAMAGGILVLGGIIFRVVLSARAIRREIVPV